MKIEALGETKSKSFNPELVLSFNPFKQKLKHLHQSQSIQTPSHLMDDLALQPWKSMEIRSFCRNFLKGLAFFPYFTTVSWIQFV